MQLTANKKEDSLFAELGVGSSSILDDPIAGIVSNDHASEQVDAHGYSP